MMMEKALPAKRRRAAKGTVLFTVVAVMMVLIVFLMGTLALAATANKRAQRNYQREQTRANAKAAIDATIDAINQSDKAVGGLKEQLSKLDDPTDTIAVNVTGSDGLAVPVVIHYDSSKTVYNKAEEKWVTGAIYRIEATSTMQSTGVATTYNAYLADDSIVSGGTNPGKSGGGGAFVTTGGIPGNIGTSGYIAGGTEIGMGNTRPFATNGDNDYSIENTTIIQAPFYVNGNFITNTQSTARFSKLGDFFAVMGNFTSKNDLEFEYDDNLKKWDGTAKEDYYNVPAMYIGGTYYKDGTSSTKIGTDFCPVNLYAGNIQFDKGITLYGNMYMTTDGGNSYISYDSKDTALYTWASKQLINCDGNEYTEVFGSVYSNGNLELKVTTGSKQEYIGNELRVKGDLNVNVTSGNPCNFYVGTDSTDDRLGKEANATQKSGDVVVGGKLRLSPSTTLHVAGNLYAKEIELNGGTLDVAGTVYSEGTPFQTGVTVTKTGETVYYFAGANGTGDPTFNYTFKGFGQYSGWDTVYEVTWNMSKVTQEYDASGNPVGAPVVQNYVGAEDAIVHSDGDHVAPADPTERIRQWMDAKVPGFNTAYFGQANAYHQEHTSSVAKNSVQVPNIATAYQAAKGDTIYPKGYDAATLEAQVIATTPTPAYAQSIAAMDSTITRPAPNPFDLSKIDQDGAEYKVCDPDGSNVQDVKNTDGNYFNNNIKGKKYLYFDSGVKLVGKAKIPIFIDAKSSMIVEISNVSFPTGQVANGVGTPDDRPEILVKDTNPVYFFIDDSFELGKACLWTTTYKQMFTTTKVDGTDTYYKDYTNDEKMVVHEVVSTESDPYYPNIIIYSAAYNATTKQPSFSTDNSSGMITAHFRAQGLSFNSGNGMGLKYQIPYSQYDDSGNEFISDKFKPGADGKNLGLIGQLICHDVNVANEWGMMFVTLPKTSQQQQQNPPPTPGNGQRAVPDRVIPMYYNYY